ncbi:hypothetical protein KS4_23170 [Poriferisphaera corsica]|uniref:Uncharacterized protein n=1 Tax=Poriferisphaera corsica TaxID=2528020 RepID=A0A517YVI9_9BACT|nr:hypothetical protein [Poriferisphaera corsica]QDU34251.1 hypothetical protein KS4_23170 [Poriferisphaera corsica]
MSNLVEHAKKELKLAGYAGPDEEGPNGWAYKNIIELIEVFAKQGHSGSSAPYVSETFSKLAEYEPLTPLTGEDDEWNDISAYSDNPKWQNKRDSRVFKDKGGNASFIKGKVFFGPDGIGYTNSDSHVPVTFPFTPKTEYIKVDEEGNPLTEQN